MRSIIRCVRRGRFLGPKRPVIAMMLIGLGSILTATVAKANDSQFMADCTAAMNRMMTAMQIQPSDNADADFVAMMVPHHQGAIDMARAELLYGQNETLRRMAQEIVVTQQQEIVAMQQALGQSSSGSPTGPGSTPREIPAMADH
jgi:DUF305 family protein family protein